MDLSSYRQSSKEAERISNIMELVIPGGNVLDVGARDGYLSMKLASYFDSVTALDLEKPNIEHKKITSVKGNITKLSFDNSVFDTVLCSEVLEHIPSHLLTMACDELARVTGKYLIIGVPYKQDIRSGRSTCYSCNKTNPPWGHVNQFDEVQLKKLFSSLTVEKINYVGFKKDSTNYLSTLLLDLAGNPYGTYTQDESCIHCGEKLISPPTRSIVQKVFTKLAITINTIQRNFCSEDANWIHVLFKKT